MVRQRVLNAQLLKLMSVPMRKKQNIHRSVDWGFGIKSTLNPLGFEYADDVFGPKVENRTLDSIRKSLKDPNCKGPETVYAIAMDVGKEQHKQILKDLHLLYGVVTYAAGTLGEEPIRSQGHMHKVSPLSNCSTPEVYEIWSGKAIIYMQEYADDNPGRCFAVIADPGEVVIVPPNWAHTTISADPGQPLTFGAWCDRAYGFEYDKIRAHNGIAWFPVFNEKNQIIWEANPMYEKSKLIIKSPQDYSELNIVKGEPIYKTFEKNNHAFDYVVDPKLKKEICDGFIP